MTFSLLLACIGATSEDTWLEVDTPGPQDTGTQDSGDTGDSGDSGDTGEQGPQDRDEDGFDSDVDCDDLDASVNPGATEVFDGVDQDCDGVVDASGEYSAVIEISASGWFEGKRYDFDLSCPAEMSRDLVDFDMSVVCSTDSDDYWGKLLLGEVLTLTPEDPYLWELDRWSGPMNVDSSNGWDTRGDGSLVWQDMNTARLSLSLDTQFLDLSGSGKLKRP